MCSIAIFVGIGIIGSFMREVQGAQFRTLEEILGNVVFLPIAALFSDNAWILLVACLVLVFMVGALISVIFALRATFRSPEKN